MVTTRTAASLEIVHDQSSEPRSFPTARGENGGPHPPGVTTPGWPMNNMLVDSAPQLFAIAISRHFAHPKSAKSSTMRLPKPAYRLCFK